MNRRLEPGFTIIESVLFLAVSTALAVGILATSSSVIAQQRYKDATTRLQSFMQGQYLDATYVVNSRGSDWQCSTSGVRSDAAADNARGTTDCFIMGKLLSLTDNGSVIDSRNVIGHLGAGVTATEEESVTNDIEAFELYDMSWTDTEREVFEIDWGTSLTQSDGPSAGSAIEEQYLFVLKSPFSGSLRTFAYNPSDDGSDERYTLPEANATNRALPKKLFTSFNEDLTYCIKSPELTVFQAVGLVIRANASSPSSIELVGDGSVC
jgi:type II secretory pathway pseudopilin PulG